MADLSLDDYINKSGKFASNSGGNMGKGGPAANQPQFTVTGLGKVHGNFDARQKIVGPSGGLKDARQKIGGPGGGLKDARQKIGGPGGSMKDARQKIMQKTKFVDARVRIESKKTQLGGGKMDARQRINTKKQAPQAAPMKPSQPKQFMHAAPGGTKVLVTGVGRMLAQGNNNVMTTPQGTLYKTIQASEPVAPQEQPPVMMWDEAYDDGYSQNYEPNPPMGYDPNYAPPNYTVPAGFPQQAPPVASLPPPGGYAPQATWMDASYDMQVGYMQQPMVWNAPPPQPPPFTRTIGQHHGGQALRADPQTGRKKLLITTTNKKLKPKITPITPPNDEGHAPLQKAMVRTIPAAALRQAAKPTKMIRTATAPRSNVADRVSPRVATRKPISAGPLRAAAEPAHQPLRLRGSAPIRRAKPHVPVTSRLQPAESVASRLKPPPAAARPSLFSRGAGTVVKVRNNLYQEQMEESPEPQYEEEVEYDDDYPIEEEEEEEEVEYVAVKKKMPTTIQKFRLPAKTTTVKRAASPPPLPVADVVSPLQGFRVLLTNLYHIVTEDDLLELFGTVGALKKVKMVRPGTAEIVFHKKDEAMSAIRKYHMRELDGQPMHLVLAPQKTPAAATSMAPLRSKSSLAQSAGLNTAQELAAMSAAAAAVSGRSSSGPLRLGKDAAAPPTDKPKTDIDPSLIHKALFKTAAKGDTPVRPVSFTVKI